MILNIYYNKPGLFQLKINGFVTKWGCPFIPIFVLCKELNLSYPILFLIDTGADITTISVSDLKDKVDYTILEKGNDAVGIGGIQECYILHDVTLLFITDSEKIIEEKLKTVSFRPNI